MLVVVWCHLWKQKGDLSLFSSLSAPIIVMVAPYRHRPAGNVGDWDVCQEEVVLDCDHHKPVSKKPAMASADHRNPQGETLARFPIFQDFGQSTGNTARQNRRCTLGSVV